MDRRIFCAAPLLIVKIAFATRSEAQAGSRPDTRPLAEVSFTLHQNGIILPAVINGRDSVRLLLDTGWGPLALVAGTAERLGLPLDPPEPMDSGGLGGVAGDR